MDVFMALLIAGLLGFVVYKLFYSKKVNEKKIHHYVSHPLVIRTAEKISQDISKLIDEHNRQAYIQNIKITYEYTIFSNRITNIRSYEDGPLVDFERERIDDLSSSERGLVGKAIFGLIEKDIKEKFPKDPGGLDYSFSYTKRIDTKCTSKYNRLTKKLEDYYEDGDMFTIVYSCKNGTYRDKTKL